VQARTSSWQDQQHLSSHIQHVHLAGTMCDPALCAAKRFLSEQCAPSSSQQAPRAVPPAQQQPQGYQARRQQPTRHPGGQDRRGTHCRTCEGTILPSLIMSATIWPSGLPLFMCARSRSPALQECSDAPTKMTPRSSSVALQGASRQKADSTGAQGGVQSPRRLARRSRQLHTVARARVRARRCKCTGRQLLNRAGGQSRQAINSRPHTPEVDKAEFFYKPRALRALARPWAAQHKHNLVADAAVLRLHCWQGWRSRLHHGHRFHTLDVSCSGTAAHALSNQERRDR
jgi:hypothetical protein